MTIIRGSEDVRIPFAVFKATGLMRASLLEKVSTGKALEPHQKVEWDSAMSRVRRICQSASDNKMPVLVDAEESWIQPAIDAFVVQMMREFNRNEAIVYNTYQLYRTDRLAFLKQDHANAKAQGYLLGAKLVRGAYMEKENDRAKKKGYPSPIHTTKSATDLDYDAAVEYCLDQADSVRLVIGSHNESSSMLGANLMLAKGLDINDKRVYFSQLYGMGDHISYNLAHAGHNVVKYVPYGPVKLVMPYLIRRAEENTSVAGQVGRELSLILKEKQRRRAQR